MKIYLYNLIIDIGKFYDYKFIIYRLNFNILRKNLL